MGVRALGAMGLIAVSAACGYDGTAALLAGDPSAADASTPDAQVGAASVDASVDASSDAGPGGCDAACDGGVEAGPITDFITIVSPSSATGVLTFQRPIDWTLAASDPTASLHYTTDGTTPTSASPGATGLTTLSALPDATRIQWLVGTNPTVHAFDVHVQASLSTSLHGIVDHVTFQPSGSPYVTVSAGTTVTGLADYQVWSQQTCGGCIDQLTVGITTAEGCIMNAQAGVYPGMSGSGATFQITAPSSPGSYPVKIGLVQQYNCTAGAMLTAIGTGLSGTVIGTIVVK